MKDKNIMYGMKAIGVNKNRSEEQQISTQGMNENTRWQKTPFYSNRIKITQLFVRFKDDMAIITFDMLVWC